MAWVRDHGHRAALLRVVCSAWAPGSSLPPCPTLPLSPSPHSSFSTLPPSLSLPGGSICSKSQANLIQCRPVCSSYIYHSCFVDLCLWGGTVWEFQRLCCDIDIQKCRWGGGRRWRACNVTPSPLLVIAVEWPDLTARSAPRPSTVSGSTEGVFCC